MKPLRATVLLALPIAALLLAGCGDDDDGSTTVTETVETAEVETTAGTETVPAGPRKEGPSFFSTPSKNIACHVGVDAARCDINERSWKPTPAPEPCELDYGQGIVLQSSGAEFVCAGDTTLGAPATLDYGQVSQRGLIRCESEEDGVTCSNTENGAGFFISRESFRIF